MLCGVCCGGTHDIYIINVHVSIVAVVAISFDCGAVNRRIDESFVSFRFVLFVCCLFAVFALYAFFGNGKNRVASNRIKCTIYDERVKVPIK